MAVVVKYMGSAQGGDCALMGCGSKNPAARAAALGMMTTQTNGFLLDPQLQVLDPQSQAGLAGIFQSGGISR